MYSRVALNVVAALAVEASPATAAVIADHVDLGPIAKRGAQSFRIPRSASIRTYPYVIAWCMAVNEPVTRARLRKP